MQYDFLLQIAAYSVYIFVVISWTWRKKKICEKLGSCVQPLKRRQHPAFWVVLLFVPLLIVLQHFRDFGILINSVLCATSILAAELVLKEKNYDSLSGIYQQGIVADGRFFPYSQITALPTIGYEEADSTEEEFAPNALKLVTENSGIIYVGFASKEEKELAIKAMLSQEPRLAP